MPKATLDAIDGKILQYLVRNARMPFLEIARECGISGAATPPSSSTVASQRS